MFGFHEVFAQKTYIYILPLILQALCKMIFDNVIFKSIPLNLVFLNLEELFFNYLEGLGLTSA